MGLAAFNRQRRRVGRLRERIRRVAWVTIRRAAVSAETDFAGLDLTIEDVHHDLVEGGRGLRVEDGTDVLASRKLFVRATLVPCAAARYWSGRSGGKQDQAALNVGALDPSVRLDHSLERYARRDDGMKLAGGQQ